MGELKTINYVLLEELDLLPSDFQERYYLDPFGEVVGGHQQELQMRLYLEKWSNYVQSLLLERPRIVQGMEVSAWSV